MVALGTGTATVKAISESGVEKVFDISVTLSDLEFDGETEVYAVEEVPDDDDDDKPEEPVKKRGCKGFVGANVIAILLIAAAFSKFTVFKK